MAELRVFSGHEQPSLLHPTSQVPSYAEDSLWDWGNEIHRPDLRRGGQRSRRKTNCRPSINMNLNRRCWNTFTNSNKNWVKRDGLKKSLLKFFRHLFWEVKSRMLNWDFNLSESNGVRTTIQTHPTLFISLPWKAKQFWKKSRPFLLILMTLCGIPPRSSKMPRPR